jgi:hypothetical protein
LFAHGHETEPAGYEGEADKEVTVDNKASCTDDPYVGETVSFKNVPTSGITVAFAPGVTGGTKAQIGCTDGTQSIPASPVDMTPTDWDDISETFPGLMPGTYTCTVVIDP